ncbi:MAG TPA: cysteine desulfurase family protein [Coriobacteriia bacterium]|nr:cysteine desulfurase family protein [Coriobacteriia bacterium]
MDNVYFDYAATTPVDERVLEAMMPFFTERWGNPSSLYALGRDGYRGLEDARERVATAIGAANPSEVIFTGCGTESDNAALIGILSRVAPDGGAHVIVSAYEHHAILEPAHWLEKHGYEVTYLKPRVDGHIHAEDLQAAMRENTKFVSVMHGNNEIGTINDIKAFAEIAHAGGALMHTDAAQTLGKLPFDVNELGVDAASFSGHKIYAPKGIGAFYLKRGTKFEPQLKGGGQEGKKRSGTQNTAGAVGFATALEIMLAEQATEAPRLAALRDKLLNGVTSALENTEVTTPATNRMPNIAPLLIKGVEGEAMLLQLDNKGIAVSTGSACSSGSLEPSHVLLSCGVPQEVAHGSLRLSLGRFTTAEHVDYFLEVFPPIVERLRAMSPVYARMFGSAS